MKVSEFIAAYQEADGRRQQAESIASSAGRLEDMRKYHVYVGLSRLFDDLNSKAILDPAYASEPNREIVTSPTGFSYETYAKAMGGLSKELVETSNRWASATEVVPPTPDEEYAADAYASLPLPEIAKVAARKVGEMTQGEWLGVSKKKWMVVTGIALVAGLGWAFWPSKR
jgi:hypothetical protein